MLPSSFTCPRCKCHALYLVRRRGIDLLFSRFGLRPLRCFTCDKRFYLKATTIISLQQAALNQPSRGASEPISPEPAPPIGAVSEDKTEAA